LAAKIRGIPIIHTIQRPFKNASKWERFMVKFLPLKKFGYSLVNKFVALGEGYFNDQKNLYQIPKHKIFLSYIGIDTKIYGPSEEKRKKFKEDIGIKNNTITLGFVGRLSPEKGLKKVFTLLKHLILHKPSVLLVVVGDGPKREEYKKEVRSLNLQDKVLFVGLRQDIDYVMNGIDIYIQATDNPLNSITSIEALACGKPIITIIRNEEERNMAQDTLIEDFNGLYFNLLEIENSTKKLTTILNPETISRMGKNSLALIKKFDIKQHIKDIEALYTTLGS
jgi:glycosyltransferase involved in cell wall biosynthesis